MHPQYSPEFVAQFWSRVDRSSGLGPAGECWQWTAACDRGYGKVSIGRRMLRAHRVAYEVTHGEVPPGLVVRHSCDNPPCCNPDHLIAGTQAENLADMRRRGRAPEWPPRVPHDLHPCTVLKDADVAAIRAAHRAGASQRSLARRYGVSQKTIWRLVRGALP